jgi:uncharacterized Zn-finger protein
MTGGEKCEELEVGVFPVYSNVIVKCPGCGKTYTYPVSVTSQLTCPYCSARLRVSIKTVVTACVVGEA